MGVSRCENLNVVVSGCETAWMWERLDVECLELGVFGCGTFWLRSA